MTDSETISQLRAELAVVQAENTKQRLGLKAQIDTAENNNVRLRAELATLKADNLALRDVARAAIQAQDALQRVGSIADETRCGWALKAVDDALRTLAKRKVEV